MKTVHDVNMLDIFKDRQEENLTLWGIAFLIALTVFIACLFILGPAKCFADETGTASWYTLESTLKEGCSGVCADGKVMVNNELIGASWFYPLGTFVRVTSLDSGKCITVKIRDRGPAKRLVKKGRVLDLSRFAFSQIADLKQGLVRVRVERIG